MRWPHSMQNFATAGSSARHLGQTRAKHAPHSRQNLAWGGFSCWHRAQCKRGLLRRTFSLRPPRALHEPVLPDFCPASILWPTGQSTQFLRRNSRSRTGCPSYRAWTALSRGTRFDRAQPAANCSERTRTALAKRASGDLSPGRIPEASFDRLGPRSQLLEKRRDAEPCRPSVEIVLIELTMLHLVDAAGIGELLFAAA